MATKMGMPRTEPRNYRLKRKSIKKVSKKREAVNAEYFALIEKLRGLCSNRSELSGESGVEPHHILRGTARAKHLCDPFAIVMITRSEHDEADSWGYDKNQEVLGEIEKTRLEQGFKK